MEDKGSVCLRSRDWLVKSVLAEGSSHLSGRIYGGLQTEPWPLGTDSVKHSCQVSEVKSIFTSEMKRSTSTNQQKVEILKYKYLQTILKDGDWINVLSYFPPLLCSVFLNSLYWYDLLSWCWSVPILIISIMTSFIYKQISFCLFYLISLHSVACFLSALYHDKQCTSLTAGKPGCR